MPFLIYRAKALGLDWIVESYSEAVDEELAALPANQRARFMHIARLMEENGPLNVRKPHVKHLTKNLYEMRMRGKDGISRAVYVTVAGQRIVVVRVFVKKTQKTSKREIDLALKRAKKIKQ